MQKLEIGVEERCRKFPETTTLRLRLQQNEIAGVSFIALGSFGRVTVTPDTLAILIDDNIHQVQAETQAEMIEAAAREAASVIFGQK